MRHCKHLDYQVLRDILSISIAVSLIGTLWGCEAGPVARSAQVAHTSETSASSPQEPSASLEPETTRTAEPRPAIETSPFTLQLQMADRSASGFTVRLVYTRKPDQAAPRTAEILIEYPEDLRLAQVNKLEATTSADKDLIVQHPSAGRARLIWMSVGHLGTIDSGPLAELKFTGSPSPESAVHILSLPSRPWFAPPAANDGVLISDPLLFEAE